MSDPSLIYLRVHTEVLSDDQHEKGRRKLPPKYPEYALVFDCETLLDTSQALILCTYRICQRQEKHRYVCIEEGLVHADEATKSERSVLREYARAHKARVAPDYSDRIRVWSHTKFIENIFYKQV